MADDKPLTLADLDARLREVEAVQALILNMLSTTKPLDRMLEQYDASEPQARRLHTLLDDLATRAVGPDEANRPSFGYFTMELNEIFPKLRNNKEFQQLVLDTLKLDRPAYRELHGYARSKGWTTENR